MSVNSIVWPKDICSSFASRPRSRTEHPALLIWKKSALMENARYVRTTSPIRAYVQYRSIVYKLSFYKRPEYFFFFFFTFFFQELPPECKNGGCFVSKPTAAPKQRRSGLFTYKDVPRGRLGKCVCEDDYISCWRRSNKGLTESDAIPGNSSLRLTHSTKSKSGFRLEVLKSGILSAVFAKYRVTRSCTSSC